MSAGGTPLAASIVASLVIETPRGDRLTLRGDGGEVTLAAVSLAALWRTRRSGNSLLPSGVTPWMMLRLPLDVNVSVAQLIVARVEMTSSGDSHVRLHWFALLRALF